MAPDFVPGDVVILDPAVTPGPADKVLAANDANEIVFRRYLDCGRSPEGTPRFELRPLVDSFASWSSAEMPIRILGVMVEHRRYR